jgi:hypothetical protein
MKNASGSHLLFLALVMVVASLPVSAQSATSVGQWQTSSYEMPINPVHVALMRNGKVLVVAGSGNDPANLTDDILQAAVWDPQAGTITVQSVSWDMLGNAMVVLPDGRPFIAGGTLQYDPFYGLPMASAFDPATNSFGNMANMAYGRWYPTSTVLGDGTVMTFSGLDTNGLTTNTVEIFNPSTGMWSIPYSASWKPSLYPRLHLLPDGDVFYSGPSPTSAIFNTSTHTWTTNVAMTNYGSTRTYGSSVLLPLTPANNYAPKVLILGGGNPATNATEIIDLSVSNPKWQYAASMYQGRIEMNAVLLPNGKVLALGGSVNDGDATTASLQAEIYDPAANTFSPAGSEAYARLNHFVALLMPDATVWVAGGNPQRGTYEQHMEVYSPPYLFTTDTSGNTVLATRPTISSAPASIGYGTNFTVQTPDAANISSVVLMRNGADTHAFDMDQRMVGLSFTAGSGLLTVTGPPNSNIAPAGYYMLFLLNNLGVPSAAAFVQVYSGPQVAVPTFSPAPGSYSSVPRSVTISASTPGATIHYTTDRTSPTTSSPVYSGPISIYTNTTIEAVAVAAGYQNSSVGSASYTIAPVSVASTETLHAVAGGAGYNGSALASSTPCSTNTIQIGSYTICGTARNDVDGTRSSVTYSPTAGNGVFVSVNFCGNSTCTLPATQAVTIRDNLNNPETCFVASPHSPFTLTSSPGTDSERFYMFYCPSIPAGVTSFTATASAAATSLQIDLVEIKAGGIASSNFWENVDNSAVSTTTGTTATVSTNGPTTNSNDFIMALMHPGSASYAAVPGTGYTGIIVNPTNPDTSVTQGHVLEAKAVSSTGVQTATITWGTPLTWFGVIAPLKGAVGSPAATPTFSPVAGSYSSAQTVTISTSSSGAIICYNTTGSPATDGTTGCTTGTLYTSPVTVSASETLYAVAGGTGYTDSAVGSAAYTIMVSTPDFSLSPSPASQTVVQGNPTSYGVTINPTNGFAGQVTLSVSGLPSGAAGSFSPNPGTSTSTLSVTTAAGTPLGTFTLTITGVSGTLTHTATVTLVVSTPDFSLSASPSSKTATQGGAASYSVSISPILGFTGQVSLSASGLPTGASGSFSPNPATTSSTLTVTTGASTPIGVYTVTITGTSGALIHTTTVSLTVAPAGVVFDNKVSSGIDFGVTTITTPAFTIGTGANRAAMIMVAMSANTATNITAKLGGVSGTLIPGTDSGTTASARTMIFQVINPPSGSQTATVSWTGSRNADVGVITVSGADQTTPTNGGTFSASNSAPTASMSVTVTSSSGDLTASVGYTADSWKSPFTNQTLKWGLDATEVGGDVGPGTGTTTHTWTDTYLFQTLVVSGANFKATSAEDFTLGASPASQTIARGNPTSYGVTVNPLNGFSGPVTLSVSGLPTGAIGSFSPNPATSTSTLSVTTDPTLTPAGSYTLTITGVSGSLTHTTTATLVVTAPDFSLSPSPASQTVLQGSATSYGFTISPTSGFASQVNLSVSGLPTGAGGSFSPNPATSTSTLSVTTNAATTPAGSYTLTITGVSGNLTHTTTVTLVVTAPDFSLGASPSSQTVAQGSPTSYNLTINPVNGFSGPVTLSVSGLPTGAGGTFTTNPATTTSALSVTTDPVKTPAGSYTLTITGVSGNLTHTTTVTLVVTAPDFTLSPSPASQTVVQGNPTSYGVTINPTNGFAGQVTLSVSGLPTGAGGSFSPNPATTSSTLSVTTSSTTPAGSYTVTITGVSGTLTHTTTVTLVVNPIPDFTLSGSPASQTVSPGSQANYTATITPANGFTGQVTLSVSGLPTGASGSFSPNPATSTSTLSMTTSASTPAGTYTLTMTGVSGSLTHTANVTLVVAAVVGVQSLTLNPTSVVGGTANSTGTVTLTAPATSTMTVALSSNNTAAATVPTSVSVAAGATQATFTVTSKVVTTVANAVITATLNGSATATLTVNPLQVASLTLNKTSVVGGTNNATATITLNAPAAGTTAQRTVALASDNTSAATVPATVTMASGATTRTFTVTSHAVAAPATANISATLNGSTQSVTLTVTPVPAAQSLTLNPTSVKGGSANSIATVTLTYPAAGTAAQRTVTLTSSDTTSATVPASVTVSSGATAVNFTVNSKVVTATATPVITATMNGSVTAKLTVTP